MGNERIRQIGQGRLEGVRSGERTRLACWRPRPRGRELPFIFSAFRSPRRTSVSAPCSLLPAPRSRSPNSLPLLCSRVSLSLVLSSCSPLPFRHASSFPAKSLYPPHCLRPLGCSRREFSGSCLIRELQAPFRLDRRR